MSNLMSGNKIPSNFNYNMVGKQFTNNLGYTATIIKYTNTLSVTVKFHAPYIYTVVVSLLRLRRGSFKNIMAPSIHGVGITGGEPSNTKWYSVWCEMIKRCYSVKYQQNQPTYIGCFVSKQWHYLPNFIKWCKKQKYKDSWDLDKDWLVFSNKEYGPKTCVFAPREINNFFAIRVGYNRGFCDSAGVTITKHGSFVAFITKNCKPFYLGTHTTEELASKAYVEAKEYRAKELAKIYKDVIPFKLYKAMRNYTVEGYNHE
jgi:hypothetical protein